MSIPPPANVVEILTDAQVDGGKQVSVLEQPDAAKHRFTCGASK